MNAPTPMTEQFAALADPGLWRKIAPQLHVADGTYYAGPSIEPIDFDASALAAWQADLKREGYIQLPPLDWGFDVAGFAQGVSALVAAGYLPVFAFMYDEAWYMYARLRRLIAMTLEDGYKIMPAFWAWHVDGVREGAGWAPHRDLGHKTLRPDGRPKAMTFWLPLTDATTHNGCMYVLPADRDELYGTSRDHQINVHLQNVRALPAAAGSVLAWTQALFHWGSRARNPTGGPRISISVEFQRGDEMPIYEPLLDPGEIPDPATRLRLILRQVLQYQHMYPAPPAIRAMAEAMAFKSGPTAAFLESMKAK